MGKLLRVCILFFKAVILHLFVVIDSLRQYVSPEDPYLNFIWNSMNILLTGECEDLFSFGDRYIQSPDLRKFFNGCM